MTFRHCILDKWKKCNSRQTPEATVYNNPLKVRLFNLETWLDQLPQKHGTQKTAESHSHSSRNSARVPSTVHHVCSSLGSSHGIAWDLSSGSMDSETARCPEPWLSCTFSMKLRDLLRMKHAPMCIQLSWRPVPAWAPSLAAAKQPVHHRQEPPEQFEVRVKTAKHLGRTGTRYAPQLDVGIQDRTHVQCRVEGN